VAEGTPILVAVGERDLDAALSSLPEGHRSALILLQNELFPSVWRAHGVVPSVLVPWVLQKPRQPTLVARESPIYGREAPLLEELLAALGIPTRTLLSEGEMQQALADKYVFILTINALGLAVDRTLGTWLREDEALVWGVCDEATQLAQALAEAPIDPARVREVVREALLALSHTPARGRTARERVARAVAYADRTGLSLSVIPRLLREAS
jgi:hypothetical protein